MEKKHQPATVKVASTTDFELIVEHDRTSKLTKEARSVVAGSFFVSSTVMTFASPVWKVLFDPQSRFREATEKRIRFRDDDPDILLLLLRIAHLQFQELPSSLDFKQLLALAILCDKYDTVHLVRPWLRQWSQAMLEPDSFSGREKSIFIAWTFGDIVTFEKWAKFISMECFTNRIPGQCLISNGKHLEDSMPPDFIASILSVRERMIDSLLNLCEGYVERYSNGSRCRVRDSRSKLAGRLTEVSLFPSLNEYNKQCDAMNLGCLIKELKRIGVWPRPPTCQVHMSVKTLSQMFFSLTSYALVEKRDKHARGSSHQGCKSTELLFEDIRDHLKTMPSAVLDCHRRHIKDQEKK